MNIIITKDQAEMSREGAKIFLDVIRNDPYAVLGLATGTTPLGLYAQLAEDRRRNGTSYRNIRTVNLDEYIGLGAEDEQSYVYFMRHNLFRYLDIPLENTHLPNGKAEDLSAECARYNALLDTLPRTVQLLGIGSNGHIAFNEPGTPFGSETHVVTLAESTVRDNSRLFARQENVPRRALTMGLKNIMEAEKIVVLASGAGKANAVSSMVRGVVTEAVPASILQRHPNCTLIADKEAASLI